MFGPLAFIALLLGSIVTGRVYTVEAAALGAIVATIYAWARSELTWTRWAETVRTVMRLTGMMFLLLMGASTFTLVFRGLNGVQMVHGLLGKLPGGLDVAILAVFAVTFCFGFFLDALEIVLLVVPIALRHDFLSTYTAARMASKGEYARLHDPKLILERLKETDPDTLPLPVVRPQFYAFLVSPLARFSLRDAFWIWLGIQIATLFACWAWAVKVFQSKLRGWLAS